MFRLREVYQYSLKLPILLVFFLLFSNPGFSQIDTDFWFVVPELSHRNNTGGTPGILRIATFELEATVTIEMPLNPAFTTISRYIAADSYDAVDLSAYIDLPATPTNQMENKALNASGINNFGIHITSTSLISVYWEVTYGDGSDLWVLKGKNGLGTLFYTPFQTESPNDATISPRPYSAIDVVATEPNTVVTFTLPLGKQASYGNIPTTFSGSRSFTLQRGQTFSLFPVGKSETVANRLGGTKVESTEDICVIVKDDAIIASGGRDVVGDQLVPVSVNGSQYVAPTSSNNDRIYIVASQPTTVRIFNKDSVEIASSPLVFAAAGEQRSVTLSNNNFFRIYSEDGSKISVFQVNSLNKSRGGAILPAISSCTGNTEVAFSRSRNDPAEKFALYLLVEKGNENDFWIYNSVYPAGVLLSTAIPSLSFTEVKGTDTGNGNWMAYYTGGSISAAQLTIGQNRIVNRSGVFHMGILNGFPAAGRLYYGYYSDYGNLKAGAFAGGSVAASQVIRTCYGSPVKLYAYGGTSYNWTGPIEYLDDPTIQNPVASNLPPGSYTFSVLISGDCGNMIIDIDVLVSSEITAFFQTDISTGCSPLSGVDITDYSINAVDWTYNLGDGLPSSLYHFNSTGTTPYPPPPAPFILTNNYVNNTDEPIVYTVTLLAKNEDGCSDIYTKDITVNPSITASFQQVVPVDICDNPAEVTFTNETFSNSDPTACAIFTDPADMNYFVWTYGDGEGHVSTDCNETFVHSYLNTNSVPETYDVRLIAISPFGCRDTVTNTVTVTSAFNPDFEIDIPNGCHDQTDVGLVVTISNISTGDISTINWSIAPDPGGLVFPGVGVNLPVTLPNTTNAPIIYTITLDVENVDGCAKSISKQVEVYPVVDADFTLSDPWVCNENPVTFTNATLPVTIPASTYSWDFGDGAGSNLTSPTHTYYNVAYDPVNGYLETTYPVKLVVTNPWGCKDSITYNVDVASLVDADFVVLPAEGCSPLDVVFTNNSLGNITDTYQWDYGNGDPLSIVEDPPNLIYNNNGVAPVNYTINFSRTNSRGCTDNVMQQVVVYPEVSINSIFPATGTTYCDSTEVNLSTSITQPLLPVSYTWSFGDGASGTGTAPTHLYRNFTNVTDTYTASVVALSEYGCFDVETTDIDIEPRIIALFSVNKNVICSGETVTFDYLNMGSIGTYEFVFDYDDPLIADETVTYFPAAPITFTKVFTNPNPTVLTVTVTLTVSNGNPACNKSITRTILVSQEVSADFYAERDGVFLPENLPFCSPDSIYFYSTITNADNYHWQFGDMGSSFVDNPIFEFINVGNVTETVKVTLTATSDLGCLDTLSRFYDIDPEVEVKYDLNNAAGCVPLTVNVSAPVDPTIVYKWDIGGGVVLADSSLAAQTFTVNSNQTGLNINIPITLTATRGLCTKTNADQVIFVYPEAEAKWSGSFFDAQCSPATISLTNISDLYNPAIPVNNVKWDVIDPLGNLVQSSLQQTFAPTSLTNFSNTAQKDYTVRLTVTTDDGCDYTMDSTFTVNPNPKAQFNVDVTNPCTPIEVDITNESVTIDALDYTWTWDGETSATNTGGQNYHVVYDYDPANFDKLIELNLSNEYGCTDSYQYELTVLPEVVSFFTNTSSDRICGDQSITFDNTASSGAQTFYWDFGDGNTYVATGTGSVLHNYSNDTGTPQNLTVTLTAENVNECTEIAQIPVTIYPRVVANQSFDITDVCNGVTINLTNSSTNAAIANSTFVWDFTTTDAGGKDTTIYSSPGDLHSGVKLTNSHLTDPVTYSLNFSAETDWGVHTCSDAIVGNNITVYPVLSPVYDPPVAQCSGLTGALLTFNKNAASSGGPVGGVTLEWDFGDGNTASTNYSTTSHTFINLNPTNFVTPTTVFATQTATGCTETITIPVTVYPKIESIFTFDFDSVCTPYVVTFTNSSLNGTRYEWDYGYNYMGDAQDTVILNKNPHTHLFKNDDPENIRTYTITLTNFDTNNNVCSHSSTRTIEVYPNVVSSLASDVPNNCSDDIFTFSNNSTGGTLNFQWDFGDNLTLTTTNRNDVTHAFVNWSASDTIFNVILTATNPNGCINVESIPVTVHPKVVADFTMYNSSVCTPYVVQFTNSSINGTSYHWDYDYSYHGVVQEDITLPGTITHSHTFQNESLEDIYYNNIMLTATDLNTGCEDTFIRPIEVYPNVVARYVSNLPAQCSDSIFVFDNLSTGGQFLNFEWDFGDGQTVFVNNRNSQEHAFTHRDETDTTFVVTLTATNPLGCTDEFTNTIIVHPKVEANFTFWYDSVCTPYDVYFTNESLNGREFYWDFGHLSQADTTYNKVPFVQTFDNLLEDQIQTYTISLIANDPITGCKHDTTKTITVYPRVITRISPEDLTACADHVIDFVNTTTGGANVPGAGLSFFWNFDDGQTAGTYGLESLSHIFSNRGSIDSIRNVIVTATNPNGCKNSQLIPITTHPKVEAKFSLTYDSLCTPFKVELTNHALNGTWFEWDFGQTGFWEEDTLTHKDNPVFNFELDNPSVNTLGNYNITMIAYTEHASSGARCADTITVPIDVYPRLISSFDLTNKEGCNPLNVGFDNTSTGLGLATEWGNYLWSFGNETASNTTSSAFSKMYSHPDKENHYDYLVRLTATNLHGCVREHVDTVTVYPLVEANFYVDVSKGCTPLDVTAVNVSTSSAYQYSWDFEYNSMTSDQAQPGVRTFINEPTDPLSIYTPNIVLVTSLDTLQYPVGSGCTETKNSVISVYPHVYPDFDGDLDGCHPHDVAFTNLTNVFSSNTQYLWSYGNGSLSTDVEPNYQFINPSYTENSAYMVRLDVTSEHGCTDFVQKMVTVYPKPKSMVELNGESISCPPFDAVFNNLSMGTNLTNYFDFGDGADVDTTYTSESVTHRFINTTSSAQPYMINLLVETEYGCQDQSSHTIYVFPDVTANFEFNPGNAACNPFVVLLENFSVNSMYYFWSFDDDLYSNVSEPIHRFVNTTENDRIFDVNLIAYSEYDCSDTISYPLTVYAAPIAAFMTNPLLQTYPNTTFYIDNLTQPAAPTWTYTWQFGDGYGSDNIQPGSYAYETWGPVEDNFRYKISLRAENPNCWDTTSHFVTLLPREPIALFEAEEYASCSPLVVNFENNSIFGNSYFWDFGDGNTSEEFEPTHTFTEPGYYQVQLIVYGDGGEENYYKSFRVYRNPFAAFSAVPERVLLPDAIVHFFSESQYADSYSWEFGDGENSSEMNPVHTYDKLGEYNVKLTVWTAQDEGGCVDDTLKIPGVWVMGKGQIRFPNAFVPNPSGPSGGYYDDIDFKNEVFHPYSDGVTEYRLYIFNRWGEQIFQSYDIKIGWDGYYKGVLCPQDVYVWRAVGNFANGKQFDLRGNVTLLR